jgi:hypothetical protein
MRLLLAATLFTLSSAALAAGYQDEIDRFFSLYEQGKASEAVDSIYSTNPWVSQAKDQVENVRTQLTGIGRLVGGYQGKQKIGEHNIGDRFTHVTYLSLYERQPVRFEFQFYRPQDKWIVYSFAFDVEFMDEVQAAARARIAEGR